MNHEVYDRVFNICRKSSDLFYACNNIHDTSGVYDDDIIKQINYILRSGIFEGYTDPIIKLLSVILKTNKIKAGKISEENKIKTFIPFALFRLVSTDMNSNGLIHMVVQGTVDHNFKFITNDFRSSEPPLSKQNVITLSNDEIHSFVHGINADFSENYLNFIVV